jgi:ABC-type antimicrobial peptide transport system permease subunit
MAVPTVKKIVASIDPSVAQANASTFENRIARKFATRRIGFETVTLFSGLALLLTAIGLYSILAYSVSQRTREIGIRIALGARPSSNFSLVIQEGFMIVGVGVAVGKNGEMALHQAPHSNERFLPRTQP